MNQAAHSYPLASLYVGDLHPDVTEAMLFEKFSAIGNVLSIRVCRDMMTRRSLGYAYVNFQLHADAERAMDTMNYDPMKGRPIRIMWSQRDPSLRRSGTGNVFIKNLDKLVDNKAMYDTFSEFGPILSCKVAQHENGDSKGYAFVHFETEAAANRAIERVNGMLLNEKKLYVGRFIPRAEREKNFGDHPRKFTNVFVKNFPEDVDDDKLFNMFEKFGKISSHRVMTDENGKSRCFGFVSFEQPENAEEAVNEMNNNEINGKTLYVGRAQKRAERQLELRRQYEAKRQERQNRYVGVNLYVKNLDEEIDDERLRKEFVTFGTINSAKIMRDPANGRSKGFGFVCYSTPEEAQKAVQEMNGKVLGSKPLYVAQAQRKEERRSQMQMNQLAQRQQLQHQQQQYRPPVPIAAYGPGLAAMSQQMMYPASFAQANRGLFPAGPNMGFGPMIRQQQPRWQNQMRPQQPGGQAPFNQLPGQQGQFQRQQGPRSMRAPGPNMGGQRPQMQNMQMNQGQPPRVQGTNVNIPPSGPRPQQNGQIMNQQGPGMSPGMRTGAAAFIRNGNNQPMGQARPQGPAQPQGNIAGAGIDPGALAKASAPEQKQVLGEKLFPIIQKMYPELAGKVTGMLLEIDNAELLLLLEQPEQLKNKVDEAVTVLMNHMKAAPGAQVPDQLVKTEAAK